MKTTTVLLMACVFCATVACVVAQDSYSKEYRNALRYGAKVKITVAVSDSNASPVSNATVNVFFEQKDGNQYKVEGKTDSLGMHAVEGMTRSSIGGSVKKEGYYRSVFRLPFATGQERIDGDRWLPWNPTIPVMLREIRNPIPMYVKLFEGKFPNGKVVGFDCEKGDFVSPYGSGDLADFTFRILVSGDTRLAVKEISIDALDPDGGFVVSEANQSSAFKSEYFAPDSGYVTNLNASSSYGPEGFKGTVPYSGNSYLIFKSRIKRDPDGNVVSANYGKIYGELVYGRGEVELETAYVSFLYYFNPTPNDRNLEFDGKNNLFKPGWNSNLNWSREP
jgi:hypothetical protein